MKPTDTARNAGSELNFSLRERQQSGFGIANLLAPRTVQPQNSDPAFQKAMQGCRVSGLKSVQRYFDAINEIGVGFLKRRMLLVKSPGYVSFRRLYSTCMATSGFPNVKDSDAAFALAMIPFNGGELPAKIRAVEIPIAVADFKCASKYDYLRKGAFAHQESDFYQSQRGNFQLLQELLR